MRLLLDTHILLWVLAGDKRAAQIKDMILAQDTQVFVSAACWWELAIKIGIGKLDYKLADLRQAAKDSNFKELPVTGEHTEVLETLPPVHKDPFDRLLVCQAITEPMKLITADSKMAGYSELIWKI